jgi:hypothetical protein
VSGAGNQQERLCIEAIPTNVGFLLSGFALGEGSFMVVARRRSDYIVKWKLSAAFNVHRRKKAEDFDRFRAAARLLARKDLSYSDYAEVLSLREAMNGGGKRRYTMQRILRDYTPSHGAGERGG